MLEDRVIRAAAKLFVSFGYCVLAEGGNQARAFRYRTPADNLKFPDLAVCRIGELIVLEAKVKARDLFVRNALGFSDYECVRNASRDHAGLKLLAEEALLRMAACGRDLDLAPTVHMGLVSGPGLAQVTDAHDLSGLTLIEVAVDSSEATWVNQ